MLGQPTIPTSPESNRRVKTVRFLLLRSITLVMAAGLGVVLLLDYVVERDARISDKTVALIDEANLLLPMVQQLRHHGVAAVQTYVDEACAQMQETTSPGHHIIVRLGDDILQARTHHRNSAQTLEAIEAAAKRNEAIAHLGGEPIVLGSAKKDDVAVHVSEFVSDVLRANQHRSLRRTGWVALVGLLCTLTIDWLLVRLIARPIDQLVGTVRRIGKGELGSQATALDGKEFEFLASEINAMSAALAREEARRAGQLRKARRIQERLRPKTGTFGGWAVASVYQPAGEVGGDYLDCKLLSDDVLVACVADVTGHGIPAAMGGAMLKTLFEAAVTQSQDPAEILRYIDKGFEAVSLEEDFASMIVVTVDQRAGRLRYASAGHEPGYLLRNGTVISTLGSTGLFLGIGSGLPFSTTELTIQPGDKVALATDGWPEAWLQSGKMLGRQSFVRMLLDAAHQSPQGMVWSALDELHRAGAATPADDDLTLLLIEWPVVFPAGDD